MENRIDVLDRGFVRLVDSMGNDLSVVRAARVSYDAAWRAGEDTGSDRRLIHYLMQNQHTTPFEAVTFTFEVYAPIFVFRQWHRHRTQSLNELSARYRELPDNFYLPQPEQVGVQATQNKQGRDTSDLTPELLEQRQMQIERVRTHLQQSFTLYHELIEEGWPKELARIVVPVSTYSHMFTTMNLLNLFKFLNLRLHPHAQYEIRVYAEAMAKLIESVVPVCVEAWKSTLS
jgi:thymidylate synthase (FAD)